MEEILIVSELEPVHVSHETYKRECRYTRGIHIPLNDFYEILELMSHDVKLYFEFHNPGKPLQRGTFLNGYSGLARSIESFYENKNSSVIPMINNGQDFYVKII